MTSHRKTIRKYSRVHTRTVGIRLSTRGTPCFISVQSMVEFTAAISLWHFSVASEAVGARSTPVPR